MHSYLDRKNVGTLAMLAMSFGLPLGCQPETKKEDSAWSVYKADAGGSNSSPLTQLTTTNVSGLKPAWTFAMHDMPPGSSPGTSECNPIVVNGVLYATSANQGAYAIDATTGKEVWSFDPIQGKGTSEVNRGLTYWENGADRRILTSANNFLYALDAKTGKPITSFGDNGKIDLKMGLRDDPKKGFYVSLTTPGGIYKNLIIIGCRMPDTYGSQPGFIRAYDCTSGKLIWTFNTVPSPGEPGYETWPPDAGASIMVGLANSGLSR